MSEVRSPFLVDLLDACRRQTKSAVRPARVTAYPLSAMTSLDLDDDVDDDNLDEDEDFDEDDEASDDESEDEDESEDDEETWQVTTGRARSLTPEIPLKVRLRLTFQR